MSKQQKKMEKKKARERAVQEKLRVKRENKRKQEKLEREDFLETEAHNRIVRERLKAEQFLESIENYHTNEDADEGLKEAMGKISEDVKDRIRENIKVLKTLEAEHAGELQARREARAKAEAAVKEGKGPTEYTPEMQQAMAALYGLEPQTGLVAEEIPVGELVQETSEKIISDAQVD